MTSLNSEIDTFSQRQQHVRSNRFCRLMQVSLRHSYYTDDLCPDFSIAPTQDSQTLMGSLGMLFQSEPSGFSVLMDRRKEADLLAYLRAKLDTSAASGQAIQPRLSFTLTVKNPNFINFTDMPIDFVPASRTFYLSNTDVETISPDRVCLNLHRLSHSLPLTGSQYCCYLSSRSQPNEVAQLVARDIAGNPLVCQPVYYPESTSPATVLPTGTDLLSPAGNQMCNPIYLNFAQVPQGKYLIEECDTSGNPVSGVKPKTVIYSFASPSPMFFIDLLFAQPSDSSSGAGVYPINTIDGYLVKIVPAQYFMEFTPRSTYWNYYIVALGASLSNLQIVPQGSPSQPVTFTGPTSVKLVNGQRAHYFVSNQPISLQEQSTHRFQLMGSVGSSHMKNGVLMNRLPVASARQVIPGHSDFATNDQSESFGSSPSTRVSRNSYSDIYVYI